MIVNQPGVPPTSVRRPHRGEVGLGIGATVAAVFTTIFLASLLCWWALPCSIIAIVLGIAVSSQNRKTFTTNYCVIQWEVVVHLGDLVKVESRKTCTCINSSRTLLT